MAASSFRSTPLAGARYAPAMALMEVLAAAALLGAVLVAFFSVMRDAQTHLANARANTQAAALAQKVLGDARLTWSSGPYSGTQAGLSWRLSCLASNQAHSNRFFLITCATTVQRNGRDVTHLDQTWVEPRQHPQ